MGNQFFRAHCSPNYFRQKFSNGCCKAKISTSESIKKIHFGYFITAEINFENSRNYNLIVLAMELETRDEQKRNVLYVKLLVFILTNCDNKSILQLIIFKNE